MQSTLWAGPATIAASVKRGDFRVQPPKPNTASLKLGFAGEDYGYAIDLGFPPPIPPSMFNLDPHIKAEAIWTGELLGRSNTIALRNGPGVRIRDNAGVWLQAFTTLASFDSMMTHCADPKDAVELLLLREHMKDWRFYDHLRTDRDAPARRPQIGTYTPVLDGDGANLAAAMGRSRKSATLRDYPRPSKTHSPAAASRSCVAGGHFDIEMRQHGLLRPLKTSELSDGTLRYLLLIAALMSPRPPALMVLNEPETSLHPDLLAPLARLIAIAAERTQIVVVSHAAALVEALEASGGLRIGLEKSFGETVTDDGDPPRWNWPSR